LYAVAKKVRHPLLATLATRVRLDNFKKVTEEIDGMVRRKFLFFFASSFRAHLRMSTEILFLVSFSIVVETSGGNELRLMKSVTSNMI